MITILSNARLLDCVGEEPLEDATVIIEKTEIKDLYTGYRVLPEGRIIDVKGMTILPGLTDAHIHPALTGLVISEGFKEPPIIIAMKIRNNLERILIGGCTTIRDMGGANFALKQAVDEGLISGPRILISNHPICQTGGVWDWSNRGDFTGLPKDDRLVSIGRIADGIDEVRKATREQFRAGASHIKTFSSGSPGLATLEARDQQQYSNGELRAIVDEASAWGSYVGAHATNTLSIKRAVEAGVRSVEHGIGVTKEIAEMMKAKGIFFVSTILMADLIAKYGSKWGANDLFIEGMKRGVEEAVEATRVAHMAGVPIAAASDNFADLNGYEAMVPRWLVEAGLKPYEALKSATIINARLFKMEHKIGSVEIGKWADLIVCAGRPDENADVLADPANIRLVMKEGDIVKFTL